MSTKQADWADIIMAESDLPADEFTDAVEIDALIRACMGDVAAANLASNKASQRTDMVPRAPVSLCSVPSS